MGRRDRFNLFIERHEVAWELSMGALALIWVAVGFLIDELGSGVRTDLAAMSSSPQWANRLAIPGGDERVHQAGEYEKVMAAIARGSSG